MIRSSAWMRYNWRVVGLSVLYSVFFIAAVYGFKHNLIPGPLRYFVAILPALPIIGIFGAIGRYLVEEQDEYVRMLMVRQTLWASALTLSVATVWGFLDNFGLVGDVDGYWVAIIWFIGLGLGGLYNKLTLGDGGACR
jgi:hypothetical protein